MARTRYKGEKQHGFIEFILNKPVKNSSVAIKASSGGRQRTWKVNVGDKSTNSVFFNSYYLDDGNALISLETSDCNGNITEKLERHFTICNGSSTLANELRLAFRDVKDISITTNKIDSSYFSSLSSQLRVPDYSHSCRSRQNTRLLDSEQIDAFDRDGFIVLKEFFAPHTVRKARDVLSMVNAKELHGFKRNGIDRLVNLHNHYPQLLSLYQSRKLYDTVSDLIGFMAYPCQSLVFINGSTQSAHQDTIHLTPFPRGLMCGIWIALEDVVPGSGELFYYPGSHRLPAVLCSTHGVPKVDADTKDYSEFGVVFEGEIQKILEQNPDLEAQQFLPEAGDVLIWHENLIHGGKPRKVQDITRMSMVIHAFGEPAMIYYDSQGISGRRDIAATRKNDLWTNLTSFRPV